MPTDAERLIVTRHAPRRAVLVAVGGVLALVLGVWGSFEAGRMLAGYSVISATRDRLARAAEIRDLNAKLKDAESRLAASEVARRVDHEAETQVEKSLAELQARLGEATQELAFYRSVVTPNDAMLGMRVQRLRVQPALAPRRFRVRLVLVQAARENVVTSATADFTVEGTRAGRAESLPLSEIGTSSKVLNFSFRYFQEVETEIELPEGFVPQTVQVEVRPAKGSSSIRQAYPWKIETT
ncbi:MAG TPA: DUF6776 family protein [Steroidobacteraceae bacterium]|nr:DUF6776 family protein [Steroidobacteraceae bacterium]